MSSALRLSIIAVLLLATAALGLIALNMNTPKTPTEEVVQQAPAPKPSGIIGGAAIAARNLGP